MNPQIIWHKNARKTLRSLPQDVQRRIVIAVERLPHGDVKPLHGKYKGFYRLRVGKYRIIFQKISENLIIVFEILPRGQAYR